MAVTEQYSCDICGKQKQQTNHWLLAFIADYTISVRTWDSVKTENLREFKHLCGQECVLKFVNKWMNNEQKES
jgi:hypothetical protein